MWSGPRPPAPIGAYSRSILDEGAVADGQTDDFAALSSAINKVGQQGGGVVRIPDRQVLIVLNAPASGPIFTLPDNVVIRGDGPHAELIIQNANTAHWNALFNLTSRDCHLEDITLTRGNDFAGAFVVLGGATDTWLYNVVLDGCRDIFGSDWHGIIFSGMLPTVLDGLVLSHLTIRRCDFGLLQDSSKTLTVQRVTVDRSLFEYNYAKRSRV